MSLSCIFCHQPVYETEKTPGAYGRLVHMRGKYRHIEGDAWACDPDKINPNGPKPRCHICRVESPPHGWECSVKGHPPYFAQVER